MFVWRIRDGLAEEGLCAIAIVERGWSWEHSLSFPKLGADKIAGDVIGDHLGLGAWDVVGD